MMSRIGPALFIVLMAGPVLAGLIGTLLPAFGYLPALGGHELSLAPFRRLAAEPGLAGSVRIALLTGLAASLLSVATVMAFTAAWAGTSTFARVQHLVSPLLSVPHAAAAFGLAFLIAPSGMLARLVSPELTGWTQPPDLLIVHDRAGLAMIVGLALKEIPFLFLMTLAALPQIRQRETAALAAALGYGRMAGFLFTVWPQVYRQIRLAVFAVIAFSTSVVDVALILGPTTPPPLAVRVVQWMSDPDLAMRFQAAAAAVLQLAVTGGALLAWMGIERGAAWLRDSGARAGLRLVRDRAARLLALWSMAGAAGLVLAGLAVLALWSLAGAWAFPDALPVTLTLRTWMSALPRVTGPLVTSLAIAAAATVIAVSVSTSVLAWESSTGRPATRMLKTIYLPLVLPQVSFLFGLQVLFLVAGLRPTFAALVVTHLVFVLPYVLLSLSDPWHAYDRRYDAIAAGLGKSRMQILLRIRLPMLLRALLVAAAVGFAVSIGLYLPTLVMGAGRFETVTTEAVALAAGGDRRIIGVWAFLQMLLPTVGFVIAIVVPALVFRRFRALRA